MEFLMTVVNILIVAFWVVHGVALYTHVSDWRKVLLSSGSN
jgi:hypothetical protein